jgi:hypothetical protein
LGTHLLDAHAAPAGGVIAEEAGRILHQAILLDEHQQDLLKLYGGKVIVFCDGDVLASGQTEEEALAQLGEDQSALPFVVRFIEAVPNADFMGGPKRE